MTTLTAPPTWLQFADAGGQAAADPGYVYRNSCGAHAAASAMVGGGLLPVATALTTVEADIGVGDTSDATLIGELKKHGAAEADLVADFNAVLAAGRYPIVLVASDGSGHPVPVASTSIRHWVVPYSNDGGVVRIANSGSGQDESYTTAAFAGFLAGDVIDSGCSGEAVATETLSQATFDAFLTYVIGLGRPPESLTALSDRAQRILSIGADASLWEVTGGKEGVSTGGICGVIGALAARVTAVEQHLASLPQTAADAPAPAAYDPTPVLEEIALMKANLATLHANLSAAGAGS